MKKYIVQKIYSVVETQVVEALNKGNAVLVAQNNNARWEYSEENTRYRATEMYNPQAAKEE